MPRGRPRGAAAPGQAPLVTDLRLPALDPPNPGVSAPTGAPSDRAWAAVADECPHQRDASAHRSGAFVHVVPLGQPEAIQCMEAEPVIGYPRFFRPKGGYPETPVLRLTFVYQAAEMTGRA